jgi:CRISPR system Cascade subunit CasA
MDNRFNLVEEEWIPVVGAGLASLSRVFSEPPLAGLGGNPIQKISVLKLLLAIAQSAGTPRDDREWKALGVEGMARRCLSYLQEHKNQFWLYGDEPFLQMPAIERAKMQSYGALLPEVATGNTSVHFDSQMERQLSDADIALVILQNSGLSFAGKKVDNSVVLTAGYKGKTNSKGKSSSAKPGGALGFLGYLHAFYLGRTLPATVYLNLLTAKDIQATGIFPEGLGAAPWEAMPDGEDDASAKVLKRSYMGRLMHLNRFLLAGDDGIHYSEGLLHPTHKEGSWDPSVTVRTGQKEYKAVWADPGKRPWRQLSAFFAFLSNDPKARCFQLHLGYGRIRESRGRFGVWTGGVRVSNNAGEQYCSGKDDFVESRFTFPSSILGESWYAALSLELNELERVSKILWACITGYKNEAKEKNPDAVTYSQVEFWSLCEARAQDLVEAAGDSEQTRNLRMVFGEIAYGVYDKHCPATTARQVAAWAKNRPNLGRYLAKEKGGEGGE